VDVATIAGLSLGAILIGLAILLGGDVKAYVDVPSVLITIGGAVAATMTAFPIARFFTMPGVIRKAIFARPADPVEVIRQLVELAEVARRDGILALEGMLGRIEDPFMASGIRMAVDGTDPEVIRGVMETELESLIERHATGKGLLDAMGKYTPAFGMIGTLIGLVAMLGNMDDPSKIGAGMAAALLTTLYGALLANLVFLPLADKLALRSAEELLVRTIAIQGVMAIQAGENPRNVNSRLLTFVPPAQRGASDLEAAA
jgi:chemotaxis protein MotA